MIIKHPFDQGDGRLFITSTINNKYVLIFAREPFLKVYPTLEKVGGTVIAITPIEVGDNPGFLPCCTRSASQSLRVVLIAPLC